MDERREGTVFFLVNYLPGASNLRLSTRSGLNRVYLESLLTPLTPPVSQLQVCCNLPCLVLHWAASWLPNSLEFGVPVATGLGGRREWGGPSLLEMQGKPCGGFTWPGVGGKLGSMWGWGLLYRHGEPFVCLRVCVHMCVLWVFVFFVPFSGSL